MRTLISFAALFLSILFVQLGSGSLGPLDALSAVELGFSTEQIGLLGSMHFLGFFLGCWLTPHLMARVGHSRAFALVAALSVVGALMHPILQTPAAWSILRILAGTAISGSYTILESWLQAKLENRNRGATLGTYRMVDLGGSLGAQMLIAFLPPAHYVSYNIVAVLCCLSLVPLAFTKQKPPPSPTAPRLRPWKVAVLSPLAVAGVMVNGLTNSSFRMVGPIYGAKMGMENRQIAFFLAAAILGGAITQIPVGWLSDRFDRRWVLIGLSTGALIVCAVFAAGGVSNSWIYITSFGFGLVAFPLYSVSIAHANDFSPPDFVVELSAALLFYFALGATISPVVSAWLIQLYGPDALFAYIAAAHVFLILFGLWRMTRRPVSGEKKPYRYLPRSSYLLGRLFKR